jgi:hypothetical protein
MANANKPSGLSPVQYLNGAPWNGQARLYSIAYNYSTALYIGDPVTLSGTSDTNGVPGIVIATAGDANAIIGAIVGIGRYESLIANPNNLSQIYYPANGDGNTNPWYAMVADDPNIIFEAQDTGTSTALDQTNMGENINLKSGTGNGYISGWGIDDGSHGTANPTYQCKLMGLVRTSDNAFGQYAKFLVKINNHVYGSGTGTAGV